MEKSFDTLVPKKKPILIKRLFTRLLIEITIAISPTILCLIPLSINSKLEIESISFFIYYLFTGPIGLFGIVLSAYIYIEPMALIVVFAIMIRILIIGGVLMFVNNDREVPALILSFVNFIVSAIFALIGSILFYVSV